MRRVVGHHDGRARVPSLKLSPQPVAVDVVHRQRVLSCELASLHIFTLMPWNGRVGELDAAEVHDAAIRSRQRAGDVGLLMVVSRFTFVADRKREVGPQRGAQKPDSLQHDGVSAQHVHLSALGGLAHGL
jgi:hypothetical protein